MEKKLPVKYGLLPIFDFDEIFGRFCVKNIRIVGYAVSECYVSSKEITYHEDGTETCKYKVVFPYTEIYLNNKIKAIENDMEDYEVVAVDQVYDDYDSAKLASIEKTKSLLEKEKKNIANYKKSLDSKIGVVESNSKMLMKRYGV